MAYLIAISGKGGVGKTTVAGLIVKQLIARGVRPVLAVDADPNTCLDAALGVRVETTVGGVREEARQIAAQGASGDTSKQRLLELKIAQSMIESDDFDYIAMGRPEGPGCYCYANNVLKATLSKMASRYPYIVLDNEAGLENLSRRIVQKVDLFVMVAEPSNRGFETVRRLHSLACDMKIEFNRLVIIVNRMRNRGLPPEIPSLKKDIGANYVACLPDDEKLVKISEDGASLMSLSEKNPVVVKINSFLDDMGIGTTR